MCLRYLRHCQASGGRSGRWGQLGRSAGQGSLRLEALQGALAQTACQRIAIATGLASVPSVSWTKVGSHHIIFPPFAPSTDMLPPE